METHTFQHHAVAFREQKAEEAVWWISVSILQIASVEELDLYLNWCIGWIPPFPTDSTLSCTPTAALYEIVASQSCNWVPTL